MRFTPPTGVVYPLNPEDPSVYQKIKNYAMEAIADLLTDNRWVYAYSDAERAKIWEEFLAYDLLPRRSELEDRIALALSELRILGDRYEYLIRHWFRSPQ